MLFVYYRRRLCAHQSLFSFGVSQHARTEIFLNQGRTDCRSSSRLQLKVKIKVGEVKVIHLKPRRGIIFEEANNIIVLN